MRYLSKKIIASAILLSFVSVLFFSLPLLTMHGQSVMEGNCPFEALGAQSCPPNAFASAFHHISYYEMFLNIPALGLNTLLALAFICAACLFLWNQRPQKWISRRIFFDTRPLCVFSKIKATKWLSLFENSPSV